MIVAPCMEDVVDQMLESSYGDRGKQRLALGRNHEQIRRLLIKYFTQVDEVQRQIEELSSVRPLTFQERTDIILKSGVGVTGRMIRTGREDDQKLTAIVRGVWHKGEHDESSTGK